MDTLMKVLQWHLRKAITWRGNELFNAALADQWEKVNGKRCAIRRRQQRQAKGNADFHENAVITLANYIPQEQREDYAEKIRSEAARKVGGGVDAQGDHEAAGRNHVQEECVGGEVQRQCVPGQDDSGDGRVYDARRGEAAGGEADTGSGEDARPAP